MTQGVTAILAASLIGGYTGLNDLSVVEADFNKKYAFQLAPGAGLGKANKVFSDTRVLAASATENLDLNGVLTDPFGAVLAFTKVKAIIVAAAAANTNDVLIGGAAANGFTPFADVTDVLVLKPGAFAVLTNPAGWNVVAATGDILKAANSGAVTGVTYDIIIIGE